MQKTGQAAVGGYLNYLRFHDSGRELQELINLLTVNETYFFREYSQLKCFAEEALPVLMAGAPQRHIRVWSAGCSSGEEAYTLAIILVEMLAGTGFTFQVLATDINTSVLKAAERAVYGERSVRDVPDVYKQKYFQKEGGWYAVCPEVKSKVSFSYLNLADDWTSRMGNLHAIFCRNVLIYFDDLSRREVALKFYRALVPGGFIFLGHSESMSRIAPIFKVRRFNHAIIYQK
jgi:chemotaxis protein methyltransferase CheR